MADQLELDLFGEPKPTRKPRTAKPRPTPPAPPASGKVTTLRRRDLLRAVMAWLNREQATALAAQVPTRLTRYKADVAAFWSEVGRRHTDSGPARILRPARIRVVELRRTRKECWPDCANSEEVTPRLMELRRQQEELQAQIREQEPDLQQTDILFEEYAEWEYNRSGNEDYHVLCREIRKLEKVLYRGTKFEALAGAGLADEAYLAVPAGVVQPAEVASGWGLLWVQPDLSIELISSSPRHSCHEENRLHVVQNIARCANDSVLFANGVYVTAAGPIFMPVPRRRRVRKS